ncbi:MAG: hypothetical protein ACRYFU_16370 [Janthinobacterium lividum]
MTKYSETPLAAGAGDASIHNRVPGVGSGFSAPFLAALSITLVLAVWILSLPCFPTTDGPVHMYYIHVLGKLLGHNSPEYAHFFRIRHLLPPYALYYYTLLLLSKFMPMLLADRLVICLYLFSFVLGFRYLARAIGPSADLMTLLATMLLLNWPLGMGFVNFCLSLSFSFWGAGLWLRVQGTRNLRGRITFLVLVTVIMLTHPVPLLLLLIVTGVFLAVRLLPAFRAGSQSLVPKGRFTLPPHARADLLTWGIGTLNLGYVKLFAVANPLKQTRDMDADAQPYWGAMVHRIGIYGREHALAFVLGLSPSILAYRTCLLLILILSIALACNQRLRNRRAGVWSASDTFLLLGGLIFVGLPFIPAQLNGLYYFADRLVVCVWLAFLFAASGWSASVGEDVFSPGAVGEGQRLPLRWNSRLPVSNRAAAGVCIVLILVSQVNLLLTSDRLIRPAAQAIFTASQQTILPHGQVGFVMEDERPERGVLHEVVSWNAYYWATIHMLRENDAILANAPWADETIIPVAPSASLPERSIPALQYRFPAGVQNALLAAPNDLRATLNAVSFFVVNQQDRSALEGPEPLLQAAGEAGRGWSCSLISWYRICQRPVAPWPAAAGPTAAGPTASGLPASAPSTH